MSVVVRLAALLAALLVAAGGARASVTVVQMQLAYEQVYELHLNSSVEYILDVATAGGASHLPSLVWVHSDGGDSAHPVFVTARVPTGTYLHPRLVCLKLIMGIFIPGDMNQCL
ncbi:unnamed protein product, partial [Brenthis ino]